MRGEPRAARPGNRWSALAILTAIMVVHQIDQAVISVVIEPIKAEFGVDDAAMGLLSGLAPSIALALFILPMGWLADRTNRVRLISMMVIVWSGLTALGSLAQSYWALLAMRFGVGAGEAGAPPAAISLLSDLFRREERPLMMGIYYCHPAIGTGLVFLLGGYIAHEYGWRAAFLIAGLPGLILGILVLFVVRDPRPRRVAGGTELPRLREAAREIFRSRALLPMLMAGPAATIATSSVWIWMASFLIRVHGFSLADIAIIGAVVLGIGKAAGAAMSGPLTRLLSGDDVHGLWRYPALVLTLSIPIGWLFVSAPDATTCIAAALALNFMLGGWPGPAMVVVMEAAPERLRGSCISFYQLSCGFLGASTGPLITGLISDAYGGGTAIGPAIGTVLCINLVAALGFYLACRALPRQAGDRPWERGETIKVQE